MLTPVIPPGYDDIAISMKPPKGWDESRDGKCIDLPVVRTHDGQAISCWKPSLRDLLRLLTGRPLWLSVFMNGAQPPVCVSTEPLLPKRAAA